jgi:hypothetical protein
LYLKISVYSAKAKSDSTAHESSARRGVTGCGGKADRK